MEALADDIKDIVMSFLMLSNIVLFGVVNKSIYKYVCHKMNIRYNDACVQESLKHIRYTEYINEDTIYPPQYTGKDAIDPLNPLYALDHSGIFASGLSLQGVRWWLVVLMNFLTPYLPTNRFPTKNTNQKSDENRTNFAFCSKLNRKCKNFLTFQESAKRGPYHQMFLYSMDYSNLKDVCKNEAMIKVWKPKCSLNSNRDINDEYSDEKNFRYLILFIHYLYRTVYRIKHCDEKLFAALGIYSLTSDVDLVRQLWDKMDQLYRDLFDVLYYLIVYSYEIDDQPYDPYFGETVLVSLLYHFVHKLPTTNAHMINAVHYDISECIALQRSNSRNSNEKQMTPKGLFKLNAAQFPMNFIEFMCVLKFHLTMNFSFLRGCIYRNNLLLDKNYKHLFDIILPNVLYHKLKRSSKNDKDMFHLLWMYRINFHVATFFLGNSKHVSNQSAFIKCCAFNQNIVQNNPKLNRIYCMFENDGRSFIQGVTPKDPTILVPSCKFSCFDIIALYEKDYGFANYYAPMFKWFPNLRQRLAPAIQDQDEILKDYQQIASLIPMKKYWNTNDEDVPNVSDQEQKLHDVLFVKQVIMTQTLYDTADNTIETPARFVIWGMNKLFGWR